MNAERVERLGSIEVDVDACACDIDIFFERGDPRSIGARDSVGVVRVVDEGDVRSLTTPPYLCCLSKAAFCSGVASVWYFSFHSSYGIP